MKKWFTALFLMISWSSFAKTIYVKAKAAGINDGTSWVNAYIKLQDGLAAALSGDQVWVAAGTYYPDEGQGQTDNARNAHFVMRNQVALYGGFAGTETLLSQRNWNTNKSILSGDLMQNDGANFSNNADNCFNIIFNDNNGISASSILDGFAITSGNANGSTYFFWGGIYNNIASPTVANCSFYGNSASYGGAAMNGSGTGSFSNCSFTNNKATAGGAMYNNVGNVSLSNCSFSGNTSSSSIIYNYGSTPILTNCLFWSNTGTVDGVIMNYRSATKMINCTLTKNAYNLSGAAINNTLSNASLTNCIIWGNGASAVRNNSTDSVVTVNYSLIQGGYAGESNLNTDPLFVNAAANDFHLLPCSPAINAGTFNGAIPSTDLDGNPRPAQGAFDMGAYEFQGSATPGILYVKASAAGTNDGSSWSNAFNKLQDAFTKARACHNFTQIWVAGGTYYPDEGVGFNNNDQSQIFKMVSGVGVYGGFSGTETQLEQRNWNTNATILSGDIQQDDPSAAPTDNDAANVVLFENTDSTTVLDGLSITKGWAYGHSDNGGAMAISRSTAIIRNCRMFNNWAYNFGGAVIIELGAPKFINCLFYNNTSYVGGAIASFTATPVIANCSFTNNTSIESAGALELFNSNAIVSNCIFWNDHVQVGEREIDGMFSTPQVSYCIIQDGYPSGTAILNQDPQFMNVSNGDLHISPCSPAVNAGTAAGAPATDLDGNMRPALGGYDMGAYEVQNNIGNILYVNAAASGLNDGSSWANAFNKLQDALAKARSCQGFDQIWVAKGTYYPDEGTGITKGDRKASFILKNNLTIYGGFTGTETQLNQRNWKTNKTILSGDLTQDDLPDFGNRGNNAIHVVTCNAGSDSTTTIDGLTIKAGYGYNEILNYPTRGGGLQIIAGGATVDHCIIEDNYAPFEAGAIYVDQGSVFKMYNSTVTGNYAREGGGLYAGASRCDLVNDLFVKNGAESIGGAIYFAYITSNIVNCTFFGNQANLGGAIVKSETLLQAKNCIFWGNVANYAPQVYDAEQDPSTLNYSIVEGGFPGAGNLNLYPMFVDTTNGDFHLQGCSPAIDAGLNSANNLTTDMDGNARINHNIIDMGAYEYSGTLYNFYTDADDDGYGASSSGVVRTSFCPTRSTGDAANNTDCRDDLATVHPGAREICGNGIDDNCNGQIDENCGSCGVVSNYVTTNITSNSATFNWTASVSPDQWQVEYKSIAQGSKWTSSTLAGNLRSTIITGLKSNQRYQWHVRAKCGTNWLAYSDAIQFITLAGTQGRMAADEAFIGAESSDMSKAGFQVYPNPTYGQFMVELRLEQNIIASARLELINVVGQVVATENATVNNGWLKKQVSMASPLTPGVYMIKVTVGKEVYQTRLIYQK